MARQERFGTRRRERPKGAPPSAAECVRLSRATIIARWEEQTRRIIPAAGSKPHYILADSLPHFLGELERSLRSRQLKSAEIRDIAEGHAILRAALPDYDLNELLVEFDLLREAIFAVLDRMTVVSSQERDIILSLIENGKAAAAQSFSQQVQKQQEEISSALHLAEERLNLALSASKMGVWDWVLQTGALHWSGRLREIWGYHPGEVSNTIDSFWSRVHPDDRLKVEKTVEALTPDNRIIDVRYRVIQPDGSIHWISSQGQAIFDSSGKLVRCTGVAMEVTEKIRAETALKESEDRYRSLFASAPVGVAELDPTSRRFIRANSKYSEMLGYSEEEMTHLAIPSITHPDDQADDLVRLRDLLEGRCDVVRKEKRYVRKTGEVIWVEVSITVVRDSQGTPLFNIAVALEITDRKRAEEERTRNLEELKRERELRERFVATLSHDLRTPLTAARMSAELLPRRSADAGMIQRLAPKIVENLDRADGMIRDLLDANRIKAGEVLPIQFSHCDLKKVAEQALDELSMIYGNRFILKGPDSLRAYLSADGVRRIIENLCSNGIKYGEPNRPVTVSIQRRGQRIELRVHNFGPTIPIEEQKYLFEPFSRGKEAEAGRHKGWGLGLALVHEITKAHQGSVQIESSDDRGTTFLVTLPLEN